MVPKKQKNKLTVVEFSALLLKLYELANETPPEELQQRVFDVMKESLLFDSALWSSCLVDQGGPIMHTIHLYNKPLKMLDHYERVKHLDVVSFDCRDALGQTINFSSNDPKWRTRCSASYLMGCELFGIRHALATAIVDPMTSLFLYVGLMRADPKLPFTEQERTFQQSLMPHLFQIWKLNRLNFMEERGRQEGHQRAIALCDKKGHLYNEGSRFSTLMRLEWPEWEGTQLPDILLERLADEQWRWQGGTSVTITCEPMNDMRLLTIRKKTGLGALSRREVEIAKYFGDGIGYRDIANSLFIAPTTVRNHIRNIYEKLDISNRIELALLLSEPEEIVEKDKSL